MFSAEREKIQVRPTSDREFFFLEWGPFLFWKMDGEVERLEMRRTISLAAAAAINAASDDHDDDVGCQSDSTEWRAQQFLPLCSTSSRLKGL